MDLISCFLTFYSNLLASQFNLILDLILRYFGYLPLSPPNALSPPFFYFLRNSQISL